jgi:hypothetical protein
MCYYSTTMSNTRDAKEQENLVVGVHSNHGVLKGESDGRTVCVMDRTTLHIEKLELTRAFIRHGNHRATSLSEVLKGMIGKSVSGTFLEYQSAVSNGGVRRLGYSADAVMINGVPVHLLWLKPGTKCYIGAKREVPMSQRVGLGHPPVINDPLPSDEAPTLSRMLAKVDGLCSITR